ncbi:MAG: hypothetical protein IKC17_00065 [Bacteroidales bacterium]|nr:hypothetical protein [Bacteroidales bacterium]
MNIKSSFMVLGAILMFTFQANAIPFNSSVMGIDRTENECTQKCSDEDKQKNKWEELESAKIAFFTTFIGITPEEAKVFWPIYNNFQKESRELHKTTMKSLKAVKELSEKGKFTDIEMKKLIKEYLDNYEKEGELGKLYIEEFYKILPVEKVAKIFLAEEEFRIKMIKMWRKNEGKE